MLVRQGERTYLEEPAKAEAADDLVWRDYYTRLPQIRLTGTGTDHSTKSEAPTEITLDGNDVVRLVECAIRHPAANMRYGVLAAIWNHPDSFRQIFQFGLNAPLGFPEIREIVASELDRHSAVPPLIAPDGTEAATQPLLPRMPLPAHLRDRKKR